VDLDTVAPQRAAEDDETDGIPIEVERAPSEGE